MLTQITEANIWIPRQIQRKGERRKEEKRKCACFNSILILEFTMVYVQRVGRNRTEKQINEILWQFLEHPPARTCACLKMTYCCGFGDNYKPGLDLNKFELALGDLDVLILFVFFPVISFSHIYIWENKERSFCRFKHKYSFLGHEVARHFVVNLKIK